jgi:hypothetical protein
MYSVINMDGLAPADRFSFWWEAVARSVVPVHASSEDVLGFRAEMTAFTWNCPAASSTSTPVWSATCSSTPPPLPTPDRLRLTPRRWPAQSTRRALRLPRSAVSAYTRTCGRYTGTARLIRVLKSAEGFFRRTVT